MGNAVDLRARLVDVEKGTAITAAQIDVVKDPTITGLLDSGIRRPVYGKEKTSTTKEGKEIMGEVPVNQRETLPNKWQITLVSYQLLEDSTIQFNFIIENLQDKPASCIFYSSSSSTYLLDNLTNQYFNPTTSTPHPEKGIILIQKMPVKFTISFSKFKKGVESVVLYLNWDLCDDIHKGIHNYLIDFGLIKLK